ncbi:MAG: phosphoribosylglycinamide formyltransferase [Hyphomicrobiaceae bacterium]|nr:phosphoribosylglycinamide formyltransferase [Hyphomicrobiaceae bacterium]
MDRKRVGILISGRGSNMMSLFEAVRRPGYPAEIVTVISNRPDAAGLAWAAGHGLATAVVDHQAFAAREDFESALHSALTAARVELVCCAGFMRLMTAGFVRRWQGRMLNIHPSLLPAFKGLDAQGQALAAGVKIAGCTVHFVVPEMDSGPIVAQAAVPVADDDTPETLSARILTAEHKLYPHALALIASGAARLDGGHVVGGHPVNQQAQLFSPAL